MIYPKECSLQHDMRLASRMLCVQTPNLYCNSDMAVLISHVPSPLVQGTCHDIITGFASPIWISLDAGCSIQNAEKSRNPESDPGSGRRRGRQGLHSLIRVSPKDAIFGVFTPVLHHGIVSLLDCAAGMSPQARGCQSPHVHHDEDADDFDIKNCKE